MKQSIALGLLCAAFGFAGCGKKDATTPASAPASEASSPAASGATGASSAAVRPALKAWQQGDRPAAIREFLATDWSAQPLFDSGSALNLSESQFAALPAAEREAKSREMMPELSALKQIASALAQAGREAAASGDVASARKHFASLQECGAALNRSDRLAVVQVVGKSFLKMAEAESAKLAP